MTTPAESTAIGNRIIIGIIIKVVCFPITITSSPILVPIQHLVATTARMVVTTYSALALTSCDIPANLLTSLRKCHTSPPCNGKDNYTPKNNNVNLYKFLGISDKIGVWEDFYPCQLGLHPFLSSFLEVWV